MKKRFRHPVAIALFVSVAAVMLVIDRITKTLILERLNIGESMPVIPNLFDFTLAYNTGAAFGIFQGAFPVFLIIALLFAAILFAYMLVLKRHSLLEILSLGLILAGALGNASDRLLHEGAVVDFIHLLFIDFPIFNVADSCIVVGVILFVIFVVIPGSLKSGEEKQIGEKKQTGEEKKADEGMQQDEKKQQDEGKQNNEETQQDEGKDE